ncbi:hypothetical protein LEMLEM_LOCUS23113 [Lemmus lemmus]
MEFGIRKSSCLDSADSEATWLRCCTMIYLVFAPGFWNEACKVLVISQVLGALTSPAFVIKSWLRIAASSQYFVFQHLPRPRAITAELYVQEMTEGAARISQ